MRLTTKGGYAVTAMLDLCMRPSPNPVTLAAISERQHISLSYLEQLFGKLRRHKLVNSVRGPGGGYRLAKSANEITMLEVVEAVDGPIRGQAPFSDSGSETSLDKRLEAICEQAAEQIRKQLQKVRISDLASKLSEGSKKG